LLVHPRAVHGNVLLAADAHATPGIV